MLALPVLACRPFAELALGTAAAAARPNILFIMTDDHAAQAISCYGSKVNRTPNLDRIASEGMRMDRVLRDQLDLHAEPRQRSSPASTAT